jgi:hypothetical protein
MLTTNRIDFDIEMRHGKDEKKGFYKLLSEMTFKEQSLMKWVTNNPYEPEYAKVFDFGYNSKDLNLPYTLIRPLGMSSLKQSKEISAEEAGKVFINSNLTHKGCYVQFICFWLL